MGIRFANAMSLREGSLDAVDEAIEKARGSETREPDLAALFVSHHHLGAAEEISARIREKLPSARLFGCTGAGIIGGGHEEEDEPAQSLSLAWLPGVTIAPFAIEQDDVESFASFDDVRRKVGVSPEDRPAFLLLADPFTIDASALIAAWNEAYRGAALIGGLASAGHMPGHNRLFLDDAVCDEGAVGVALSGDVVLRTVVSQGCRPIGKHHVVTKAKGNVILSLGGKPPLEVIRAMVADLEARDRELVRTALHIGRVINENQLRFDRGDFLIRNPIHLDPESGAMAFGDVFRVGQTVQFHVRDKETASEDLKTLLEEYRSSGENAAGAFLFSCNGRGKHMFGVPDHDTGVVRDVLGSVPVAGFFCAGEIGPIGGRSFLHGFTSSLGFLVDRDPGSERGHARDGDARPAGGSAP